MLQGRSSTSRRHRRHRSARIDALLGAASLIALAWLALAGPASAAKLLPEHGKTLSGVTETDNAADFEDLGKLTGQHPAVAEAFHTWGTHPWRALRRWSQNRARGMLSISTATGYLGAEVITPRQIAKGLGDTYLVRLNQAIGSHHMPIYIRFLGEPNNWHNPYSAVSSSGGARDRAHSHKWYKAAWRRAVIVVRNGGSRKRVNARLHKLGLHGLRKPKGRHLPKRFYRTKTAFVWTPIVSGSPRVKGNRPSAYWPGRKYVDWVGTDFYSREQPWKHLERFYKRWANGQDRPFAFGEWGVRDFDNRSFVKRLFRWQRAHRRARLMVYFQGFGNHENPFSLFKWPGAAAAMKHQLKRSGYPAYPPEWRGAPPVDPGGSGGVGAP